MLSLNDFECDLLTYFLIFEATAMRFGKCVHVSKQISKLSLNDIGYDLLTGEVKRSFLPDKDVVWLSHHRCHISKATQNYIVTGRMGLEFVDLENETWQENHWIRGGCLYGAMPCNGLLYAPPHACACYFEAKQHGFVAMTGKSKGGHSVEEPQRLEKGPAYSEVVLKAASPTEADSKGPLTC